MITSNETSVMRSRPLRRWQYVLGCAAALVVLAASSATIVIEWLRPAMRERTSQALWVPLVDNYGSYHLRLLRYHGKESKDQTLQEYHAKALTNVNGIDALLDEVASGHFDGRYSPGPYTILRRIGIDAQHRLVDRCENPHDGSDVRDCAHRLERVRLLSATIVCFDLFEYLEPLVLALDAAEPHCRICSAARRDVEQVRHHLENLVGGEVPDILSCDARGVEPKFKEWILQNRQRLQRHP